MINSNEDIISAIITPNGVGAISVIRVSGNGSIKIIDNLFKGNKKLSDAETHTIHYGKIISSDEVTIDDVLVSVFKGDRSYTGEESLEISTHGTPVITEKIINQFLQNGVRLAEPGEFTKRSFLNGKMDLAQAEAVADIINSRTEASLKGARNQLDGVLSSKVNLLRQSLINISSLLELELDFAEEELEFIQAEEIKMKINQVIQEIDLLVDSYSYGKTIKDGANVAIVGKPNVGKSSILNKIVKEARAIVSSIPGTTRDVIKEEVSIDGILFNLFDTAGIRFTEDEIELEGVKRSRETVSNADLILFINDITEGINEEIKKEILELSDEERVLTVLNKSDLSGNENNSELRVSAKTGEGLEELFNKIKNKAIGVNSYTENTAIVSNVRHVDALRKSREALVKALGSLDNNFTGEFISVDLRGSIDALGEIIGEVSTDDILNNIFSSFCIGK